MKAKNTIRAALAAAALGVVLLGPAGGLETRAAQTTSSTTLKEGWIQQNGHWYYQKSDGFFYKGWLQIGDKYYYLNTDGSMKTGWLKFDNSWYYLEESGVMHTGWLQLDGKWY